MTEVWKDIPGWEGLYQASTAGRVRSVDRTVPHKRWGTAFYSGKVLTAKPSDSEYLVVVLSRGSKTITKNVHVLVMVTFVGPRPDGLEVCHWDGDKTNVSLENLRYDTPQANLEDKWRHGTHPLQMLERGELFRRSA